MKGLQVWYKSPQVRAVLVYEVCVVHWCGLLVRVCGEVC